MRKCLLCDGRIAVNSAASPEQVMRTRDTTGHRQRTIARELNIDRATTRSPDQENRDPESLTDLEPHLESNRYTGGRTASFRAIAVPQV
jgi:hypothetical protein